VGGNVLTETDGSGNVLNDYVYFAGGRIGRVNSSGKWFYYGDHLGSSRSITDSGGNLCYDADFYLFGAEKVVTNTCPQNYKWTGLERDTETGLDHSLLRQYSSNTGRWLSPNPMGGDRKNPQSLNRYGYALDNPIGLTVTLDSLITPQQPLDQYAYALNGPSATSRIPAWPVVRSPWTVPWWGSCDPRLGPTAIGCNWNGHLSETYASVGCVSSAEYGCNGPSTFGEDIFDALAGERGTYLTVNRSGDISFGFSIDLWQQEWALYDNLQKMTVSLRGGNTDTKFQDVENMLGCIFGTGGCVTIVDTSGTSGPLQTLYELLRSTDLPPDQAELRLHLAGLTSQPGAPSGRTPPPNAPPPVGPPGISIPMSPTYWRLGPNGRNIPIDIGPMFPVP
jgi:RHS repeat-associated protein